MRLSPAAFALPEVRQPGPGRCLSDRLRAAPGPLSPLPWCATAGLYRRQRVVARVRRWVAHSGSIERLLAI
jgi:hypothetical protein